MAIPKQEGLAAMQAMLGGAGGGPPGGALDLDGGMVPTVTCGVCGSEVDSATGEPVEMVGGPVGAPPGVPL